ncbi:MAG: hypothetical protein DI603_15140 [Roseateles depolymerans]|uniref:DUF2511 domain-containing protein n=1 Tax=Roseateles depolymerans TaxID=76731 RepID=A0A2W5DMS7_9BURK|nr:MAG: hypothetical protein DI603_15140 [Roseateles depolymerans]
MFRIRRTAAVVFALCVGASVAAPVTDGRVLTAADVKGAWPLTVKAVTLRCADEGRFVAFETPDGRLVAVNGKARGSAAKRGLVDLDAVWAVDAKGSRLSTMVDLSRIAIDACKGR